MPAQLLKELTAVAAALRRGRAVNVNDANSKNAALALATRYRKDVRPKLAQIFGNSAELLAHDEQWSRLHRLAQNNSSRRSYLNTIRTLREQLASLDVVAASRILPAVPANRPVVQLSAEETLLVETLEKLVPSAAASYTQGCLDLATGRRTSYRGTASEFREALREVLDHLAPDKDVMAETGFELEREQTRPTMRQKAKYILASRHRNKTHREALGTSLEIIEELVSGLARTIYTRAAIATHTQQGAREVRQLKRYVDTALFEVLEIAQSE